MKHCIHLETFFVYNNLLLINIYNFKKLTTTSYILNNCDLWAESKYLIKSSKKSSWEKFTSSINNSSDNNYGPQFLVHKQTCEKKR